MRNSSVFMLILIPLAMMSLSEMGSLIRTIFPPKDIYDYLINESLDITEKGLTKKFEFKNKYSGHHSIGILLDKFSDDLYFKPLSQRYILKLKMEVNFYSQSTLILSRVIENKYYPFIGKRGNGWGFITYKSPLDLPLDKVIVCEVKILEPDDKLSTTLGPVRFYIKKDSDK